MEGQAIELGRFPRGFGRERGREVVHELARCRRVAHVEGGNNGRLRLTGGPVERQTRLVAERRSEGFVRHVVRFEHLAKSLEEREAVGSARVGREVELLREVEDARRVKQRVDRRQRHRIHPEPGVFLADARSMQIDRVANLAAFKAGRGPDGAHFLGLGALLRVDGLAAGFREFYELCHEHLSAAEDQRRVPSGQLGEHGVVVGVLVQRGLRGGGSAVFDAVDGGFEQREVVGH